MLLMDNNFLCTYFALLKSSEHTSYVLAFYIICDK